MTYFTDLNTYLHRSSQLIQAYPSSRITTKYSLPKKRSGKADTKATEKKDATTAADSTGATPSQTKREPSAILTLKTYHPDSGICLKYKTDKAAEVGRLLAGLGRLAKGELIELPTAATVAAAANDADKMDIDSGVVASEADAKVVVAPPAATQTASGGGGGGGKGKKKKGKK
ncbi:hypothetical protein LTR84_009928 [Exophiala bonariae]|uniref:SRP9 domain-containing protein n=1 Tax=Exophiala bonariae TaxID=1690606 RepID=A0AAV9NJK6_9EURO|nr:hypothetical protein LTR84_009928 [Exophiala bonariae]